MSRILFRVNTLQRVDRHETNDRELVVIVRIVNKGKISVYRCLTSVLPQAPSKPPHLYHIAQASVWDRKHWSGRDQRFSAHTVHRSVYRYM